MSVGPEGWRSPTRSTGALPRYRVALRGNTDWRSTGRILSRPCVSVTIICVMIEYVAFWTSPAIRIPVAPGPFGFVVYGTGYAPGVVMKRPGFRSESQQGESEYAQEVQSGAA